MVILLFSSPVLADAETKGHVEANVVSPASDDGHGNVCIGNICEPMTVADDGTLWKDF